MTKFGMHFSLWAPEWTTEAANAAIPQAARYGLEIIEIPLFEPAKIDLDHAKSIIRDHGLQATASLCLPEDKMAHGSGSLYAISVSSSRRRSPHWVLHADWRHLLGARLQDRCSPNK